MDDRTRNIVDECRRMEESCLYTSTTLFEWLKCLRFWRAFFVVIPIILGGVATWPLLTHQDEYGWITGVCALLASLAPAIYTISPLTTLLREQGKVSKKTVVDSPVNHTHLIAPRLRYRRISFT